LKTLAGVTNDSTRFSDILIKAKALNPLIEYKEGIIHDLYGLRNVLSHGDRDKYIAEINQIAIDELEKIIKLIEKPPLVRDIFKTDVYTVTLDDTTSSVIFKMKKKLYTHIPVYDDIKCVGVLSESSVFEWLVDNISSGTAKFEKIRLSNFDRKYLHPRTSQYKFIKASTSIFDAYKMFQVAVSGGKRLGAVFITESGVDNEQPIGIITAWDLPKVKNYFE